MRIGFAVGFLAMLMVVMFDVSADEAITQEECMRDYTFIWTATLNTYLADHSNVKDAYIIFSSALIDILILTSLVLFFLYTQSFRLALSYILFYGIRGIVQVSLSLSIILYRKYF